MSTTEQDAETLEAAAVSAVVEFALTALQPEYMRTQTNMNLMAAEAVWNACSGGPDLVLELGIQNECEDLVDHLTHVHRARWPDASFLIAGLHASREEGRLVFSFDLTWDEFRTLHPIQAFIEPCACMARSGI